MREARTVIRDWFGYHEFRPLQKEIIHAVVSGHDVVAIIATGGGKSLCYQVPAMMMDGVCIVISPLIALMKDQVDGLCESGIPAAYLTSSVPYHEKKKIEASILDGTLKVVYVSPERMVGVSFLNLLKAASISLFAVDEAHCISQWGHEFRPEYRQLKQIRETFPSVPIIALTATATPFVQEDIRSELLLRTPDEFVGSFNRHNLVYRVFERNPSQFADIVSYLKSHRKESGIIYCSTKKTVEDVYKKLVQQGISALPYHADIPKKRRDQAQDKFLHDDVDIIVATVAFGMGINKPDVRYVVHYDMPKSIEAYYQETGRAGRDGEPADCIMYYSRSDWRKHSYFIDIMPEGTERHVSYRKLNGMLGYCESHACRRAVLLTYFGEDYHESSCKTCDICISGRTMRDGKDILMMVASCVEDTGGLYGTAYLSDILSGIPTEKVLMRGHETLPVFGIGSMWKKPQWVFFIRELTFCGFLTSHGDRYPVIRKNDKTIRALSGQIPIMVPEPDIQTTLGVTQGQGTEYNHHLYEILIDIRNEIADQEDVAPYRIFPNKSLQEMARAMPTSDTEFLAIHGVGEFKLQKYGPIFIKSILEYQQME